MSVSETSWLENCKHEPPMVARLRVFLPVLLALAAAQPAAAGPQSKLYKLDLALREALTKIPEPQHVIIRTKDGCRAALRRALVAHGDVIVAEHPSFGALTAYAHGEDLEALANDPCVASVSWDAHVSPSGAGGQVSATAAAANLQRALKTRKAPPDADLPGEPSELRQLLGLTRTDEHGEGIGVAILDSGLELSSDFDPGRVRFWDFTRGGVGATPYDDYGHGTHVAGLIAGSGRQSGGKYAGVAPDVNLRIFKVLDRHGRGRTSQVLRAIEYIIANRHLLGVDVINVSLGHPVYEPAATDPLVQAVELAARHGIVVVVSAGNNGQNPLTGEIGYGGINSPANAPSVITVGAANTYHTVGRGDDDVPYFSSRGPTWYDGLAKPDVVAPGVALVSNAPTRATLYRDFPELLVDSHYARLSGTSMASAVTTGLVATMMAADRNRVETFTYRGEHPGRPFLKPNAIKAVLQYTAMPLWLKDDDRNVILDDAGEPVPYDLLTQGAGEINGHGALLVTRAISTLDKKGRPLPLGAEWADLSAFDHDTLVFGSAGEGRWFENIVWGSFVVDGRVVSLNSRAWDNIVWGTVLQRDKDNIVWGTGYRWEADNIVWGTVRFTGDDNIVWGTVRFAKDDNIVWGSAFLHAWADNIVWGNQFLGLGEGDNIVWGSAPPDRDNIVWGSLDRDNIVWGNLTRGADNIVWGSVRSFDDNIVWGTGARSGDDNIVWGTTAPKKAAKTTAGGR